MSVGSRWASLALGAALAIAPAPAPAQCATAEDGTQEAATDESLGYVGVNPGTVREVDVTAGRVCEPLPFDVQFFIESNVDTGVEEVSGRFLQERGLLAKGRSCQDVFPDSAWEARGYLAPLVMVTRGGDGVAIAASLDDRPVEAPASRAEAQQEIAFIRFIDTTTEQDGKPTVTARKAELSVPPLAPNRDICFEFTLVRRIDQEAFRKAARLAVETELRSSRWVEIEEDDDGSQRRSTIGTPAAFNRLRRRLLSGILAELGRGERLEAPRGSFFDPHVNLAGVEADYTSRFVQIMGDQTQRFRTLDNIRGTVRGAGTRDELIISLRRLLRSGAYKRLKASGTLAKTLLGDSIVPGLNEDSFSQWADGLITVLPNAALSAQPLDLEAIWQPGDLGARQVGGQDTPGVLGNLETGLRGLERLLNVVERYAGNLDLARMDGLQLDPPGSCSESRTACSDFQGSSDCPPWDPDGPEGEEPVGQSCLNDIARLDYDVGQVADNLYLHLEELRALHGLLDKRQRQIDAMIDELALELETKVRLLGTTTSDYKTRASTYISADVGVGFAPDVEESFTYFGTNIYFRPVNKKAPLRGLAFWKRFSIMVGLTSEALESEGQLKGIVGSSPLLVAGGFRLNDFLRLSAGAVVFKDEDPNPTITDEQLAWSPYVSLSIDWNLRKIFARFGGALNLSTPPPALAEEGKR